MRTRILLLDLADYRYNSGVRIATVRSFFSLGPEWLKPHARIWSEYNAEVTGPRGDDNLGYHSTYLPCLAGLLHVTPGGSSVFTAILTEVDGYSLGEVYLAVAEISADITCSGRSFQQQAAMAMARILESRVGKEFHGYWLRNWLAVIAKKHGDRPSRHEILRSCWKSFFGRPLTALRA